MGSLSFNFPSLGMWGAGGPRDINYDFNKLYVDVSGSPSTNFSFGFNGGLKANLSANIGADYELGFGPKGTFVFHAGSIAVNYTLGTNFTTSVGTQNTNPYINTSDYNVTSGRLQSTGIDIANSSVDLDLNARLYARVHGDVTASAGVHIGPINGDISKSANFDNTLADYNYTYPLIHAHGSDIHPFSLNSDYGTLTVGLPSQINTSTNQIIGLGLGSLEATGTSSPFVSANLDITKILGSVFGIPPAAFGGNYNLFDLGIASATVDYSTLAARLNAEASLKQTFNFTPDQILVTMTDNLGQTLSGNLGDQFFFDTPVGEGDIFVGASYKLIGRLTSETDVHLSSDLSYQLLSLDARGRIGVNILGKDISASGDTGLRTLAAGDAGLGEVDIPIFYNQSNYRCTVGNTFTLHYNNLPVVEDGYLSGATVFIDTNGNRKLDSGESSTVTDATGHFKLAGSGVLLAQGGFDTYTGLAFAGTFSAPSGSGVISPLTTLIGTATEAQVKLAFGLRSSLSLTTFDALRSLGAGNLADGAAVFSTNAKIYSLASVLGAIGAGTAADGFAAISNLVTHSSGQLDLTNPLLIKGLVSGRGISDPTLVDKLTNIITAELHAIDLATVDPKRPTFIAEVNAVERMIEGVQTKTFFDAGTDINKINVAADHYTGQNLNAAIAVARAELSVPASGDGVGPVSSIRVANSNDISEVFSRVNGHSISDADSTSVMNHIKSGDFTLDQYVDTLIQQAKLTTVPAIVVSGLLGPTPNQQHLGELADFDAKQLAFYTAAGVSRPQLGPFEALGLGFSETSAFKNKYDDLDDSLFVTKAYFDTFGRAGTNDQIKHFNDQLGTFETLYAGNGQSTAQADLHAKGAVFGQMVGIASLDEPFLHPYLSGATTLLHDIAIGKAQFGDAFAMV